MPAYNNEAGFTEDPKGQWDLVKGKGWSPKCITRRLFHGVAVGVKHEIGLKSETPRSMTTFRSLNFNPRQRGGRPPGNLNSRMTLFPDELFLI